MERKLGCKLAPKTKQSMAIADGNSMKCQLVCRNFKCTLHGIAFVYDILLLPLGGCNLVLRAQWLSTLGTIKWDFQLLRMEFRYQGRLYVLSEINPKRM